AIYTPNFSRPPHLSQIETQTNSSGVLPQRLCAATQSIPNPPPKDPRSILRSIYAASSAARKPVYECLESLLEMSFWLHFIFHIAIE
ncbi:unnamed protein product, partial [Musa acuminata subsp. burmannicoides]